LAVVVTATDAGDVALVAVVAAVFGTEVASNDEDLFAFLLPNRKSKIPLSCSMTKNIEIPIPTIKWNPRLPQSVKVAHQPAFIIFEFCAIIVRFF